MLALRFGQPGETPARFTTTLDEIAIGSAASADLVLTDPRVGATHARLLRTGGGWVLHAQNKGGVYVNALPVTEPTALAPGDTFIIGPFILSIERDDTSAEELRLLAALTGDDETGRAVYADWLEEHGHANRAEFLRAQIAVSRLTPADRTFHGATARVRELARGINIEWRMRVARPAVEGCKLAPEVTCGVDWAELAPTGDPTQRSCTRCREIVHYCATEQEAIEQARAGHCIVVDFASLRSPMSVVSLARTGARTPQIAMPGMYMPTTHIARPRPPEPPPVLCPQCGHAQPFSSDRCRSCDARLG